MLGTRLFFSKMFEQLRQNPPNKSDWCVSFRSPTENVNRILGINAYVLQLLVIYLGWWCLGCKMIGEKY